MNENPKPPMPKLQQHNRKKKNNVRRPIPMPRLRLLRRKNLMNPTETLLKSQLQESRQSAKLYKQTVINMARASIKQITREDLIEILIKKRIIERDWSEKGNKYKIKENVN